MDLLNLSFIFSKMPESVGLLIFGIGLIVFTVLVRRVLNRAETSEEK
jgi:cell division protein FtsW (lipid II flippase)